MSKEKMSDFDVFLSEAKLLKEFARIPNFESYLQGLKSAPPLMEQLNHLVFVIDFRVGKFLYLGPNSQDIQGWSTAEIIRLSPMQIMELYHPEDAEIVITKMFPEGHAELISIPNVEFSKARIAYNFRFRQKDNSYKMLLQQFSFLVVDDELNPLVLLGTLTDISDIHKGDDLFCRISVLGKNNKWKKVFERYYTSRSKDAEYGLSSKEIEIIKFVNKGKSTKEIAVLTGRSPETIKSQRKKILQKTGCASMVEVIAIANHQGWV